MGMETRRLKSLTESKPGKVFQTGSSPTDSTRIDLSYSCLVLGGVVSTSQSAGWWQKPTRQAKCKQCAQCGVVKEFGKDFHMTQLGRGSARRLMIAFITCSSNLVPLLEGLCSSNPCRFELSIF